MPLMTQQTWLCDICPPHDQREGVQTCPRCDKVLCMNHAVMVGGGGHNAVFFCAGCVAPLLPEFRVILATEVLTAAKAAYEASWSNQTLYAAMQAAQAALTAAQAASLAAKG